MRRRENIIGAFESYISELKENVAQKGNISELEIVRYIYINLGRKMNFDLNYTFGNSREKTKIYNDTEDLDSLFEKRTVICKSLAIMIRRILSEFGISSIVDSNSETEKNKHVFNIVKLSDGRYLKIDLEEDLEFIQTGSKTRFFKIIEKGSAEEFDIPEEELRQIDKTVAEYIPWGFYFDDVLGVLKFATKGMSTEEKLKNVLDNLDVYVRDRNIGYRDKIYYHNRMLQEVFTQKELNRVHQIDCYRKSGEEKEFVSCVVLDKRTKNDENIVYLYDDTEGRYRQITMEELALEVKGGLVMLQGVQGLRKYLMSSSEKSLARSKNTTTIKDIISRLNTPPDEDGRD